MDVGSLIQLSYLHASVSLQSSQLGRADGGVAASEGTEESKAKDGVQISAQSARLFGARVQVELEQFSISSIQQVLSPSGKGDAPDPLAPLRRFQGILQNATKDAGLQTPTSTDGVPDFLKKLQDYFNPENTAQRIFEYATKHYGKDSFSGKDGVDLRTKYRDYILPAIQKGFDQAKAELGKLPDGVNDQIAKTFSLLQSSFDRFVKNGLPQEQTQQAATTPPKDAAG